MLIAIEIFSVFFNLLYLYYAIRQKSIAWIFGFIASLLSVYLFYQNHYIGSAVLNLIYAALGVLGFLQWHFYLKTSNPGFKLSFKQHIHLITVISALFYFIVVITAEHMFSTLVRIDILLSLGSIAATFLEIRKDTSCWYYWIVLNLGFAILYGLQHMYFYAFLMLLFAVFSRIALMEWKRSEKVNV